MPPPADCTCAAEAGADVPLNSAGFFETPFLVTGPGGGGGDDDEVAIRAAFAGRCLRWTCLHEGFSYWEPSWVAVVLSVAGMVLFIIFVAQRLRRSPVRARGRGGVRADCVRTDNCCC